MSKRLQVILPDDEFSLLQETAQKHGVTVSEWVRRSLRRAHSETSTGDRARKLAAIRAASKHSFPTADIETMLEEIERGYLS